MHRIGQILGTLFLTTADPSRLAEALLRPHPQPMIEKLQTQGTAEPVQFPTKGGLLCRGWWIRPAENANPDRCVVLAHGWTSHALRMQSFADPLLDQGYAVLLYSCRGHGNSDHYPICSALQFAEDVEAAVAFARTRAPRVAVIGHSLGAAGAILAAANGVPDAVVALASPADQADVLVDFLRAQGIAIDDVYERVQAHSEAVLGCTFDSFAPERRISEVKCPLLLVHGAADEVVPVAHFHRLCRAAGPQVERLLVEGANHDSVRRAPEALERIWDFLKRSLQANG